MANEWREHPKLKGRFLPDHPDDLQVIVHDGGPRITRSQPETVWVTVTGIEGEAFKARVLNQPHNLRTVRQESEIKFVLPGGSEHPVMVTDKYLRERGEWIIHPCSKCGMSELFDAPSDLMRTVFPNVPPGDQMSKFTAFCPVCGGVQVVESKSNPAGAEAEPTPVANAGKRPWWKFWA